MRDYSSLREMNEFNKTTSSEINSLVCDQVKLINSYIMSGENMNSLDRIVLLDNINKYNRAIQKRMVEMTSKQYGITDFFQEEYKKEKDKEESE